MLHYQVVADRIERVGVQARGVGCFETFVKFKIEDLVPQRLGGANFGRIAGEPGCIVSWRTHQEANGFQRYIHDAQAAPPRCP
jgi:hypothetical protein